MNIFHSDMFQDYFLQKGYGEYNNPEVNAEKPTKPKPTDPPTTITTTHNGETVKLTLSKELKLFTRELKEDNIEKIISSLNPDDIFSYSPHAQWEVFHSFLQGTSFYQTLSLQQKEKLYELVQDITLGIDSLTNEGIPAIPINQVLDSNQAKIEFASSISALRNLSEKLLNEADKTGFEHLIKDYITHNEPIVDNYQSHTEKFYIARSKLDLSHMLHGRQPNQLVRVTNRLAEVQHTEAEILENSKFYHDQFSKIEDQAQLQTILMQVKKTMLSYIMKGIYEKHPDTVFTKQHITDQSTSTFDRIENYWSKLLKDFDN